jgi:diguanylate cyclase (GGDEF)-like protein
LFGFVMRSFKITSVSLEIGRTTTEVRVDPVLARWLARVELLCLSVVCVIATVTLFGWLFPPVDPFLFHNWTLMKANTALLLLLSALSLTLTQEHGLTESLWPGRAIGAFVSIAAAAVLGEYLFHASFGIDTILAADAGATMPGRMSPQTACTFLLLGAVMLLAQTGQRVLSRLVDLLTFLICSFVLIIVSGYVFGAMHLLGLSANLRTSQQTLISLALLALVLFGRRIDRGIIAILLSPGVGGKLARVAAPLSLCLPFILESSRVQIIERGLLTPVYSMALVTVFAALLGFSFVLVLARRIDDLEDDIRDLSIRDDLTKLYNRRGFMFLAGRDLKQASRAGSPYSVLYVDLDNLKLVNDTFGHDVGSEFICEMAHLLAQSFRDTDVVGRIGGDEFVVGGMSSEAGAPIISQRLALAAAELNRKSGRLYPFSFSAGHVTLLPGSRDSLEDLLKRADTAMYEAKRIKKTSEPV